MEPSKLPDSIFDKELTRKSGLLDLPDSGDSVMADHGYDIENDVIVNPIYIGKTTTGWS